MHHLPISQSTPRLPSPADQIPVEISGCTELQAGHLTVAAFHQALPTASETLPGAVLTASAAAVVSAAAAAGPEPERVVTPAALAHRVNRVHFAPAFLYIGQFSPTSAAAIYSRWMAVAGHPPTNGDPLVMANLSGELLVLSLESSSGAFHGFNATLGEYVSYL